MPGNDLDRPRDEDGPRMNFDPNGCLLSAGGYENGELSGFWTYWWETGVVWMTGYYKGGKPLGRWRIYYDDGVLWGEGNFSHGKEDGPWLWYHPDGTVDPDKTGIYEFGKRVRVLE